MKLFGNTHSKLHDQRGAKEEATAPPIQEAAETVETADAAETVEAVNAAEATEAPAADNTTSADEQVTTGDDTTYVGGPAEEKNSTLTTVLTVAGIAVLGVVVFLVTVKLAGGSGKKEEAETVEGKKEEK